MNNKMMKLFYILSVLFMTASCGPDNLSGSESPKLSVDHQKLEFTAEGGEKNITVTSSDLVRIVPGENWMV